MLEDKHNTEDNRRFLQTAYKLIPVKEVAAELGQTRQAVNLRLNHLKNLKLKESFDALMNLGLGEEVDFLKKKINKLNKEFNK